MLEKMICSAFIGMHYISDLHLCASPKFQVLSRQKDKKKYFIMLQLKAGLQQYSSKHLKKES